MHLVGHLRAHQIDELFAVGKIVDHQNIAGSGAVQPTHQVAADKTRTARHHNHNSSSAVTTDVPSFPTTIPPARLASKTASNQDNPVARATASAARTVSPAPETSNTSCACASVCWRPSSVNRVIPCSERVTRSASSSDRKSTRLN